MALVLPYPNKPANGDSLDATVVQANFTAIAQAIQSFDGSQIQAASIQAASMAVAANPITRGLETQGNFVFTGVVVSTPSGLNISITGGTLYINGNRLPFAGVGSQTLLANKDYYIDIDNLGNVTYANVANGGTAPALTANSIRVAQVITGATVGLITQTGFDNIGTKIYYTGAVGGAQAPGLWFEEMERVTLGASAASVSLSGVVGKKYLKIIIDAIPTGGSLSPSLRFNGDTATNYSHEFSFNFASPATTAVSQTSIVAGVGTISQAQFTIFDVINISALEKTIVGSCTIPNAAGGATAPGILSIVGKWASTGAQITSLQLINAGGSGTFAAGTEIVVLGHN